MVRETVPSSGPDAAAQQGWVLVLVREPRVRSLLLSVLSQAGYILLGCATLAEAGQVLGQQSAPRLILLDGAAASEERLREQVHQLETALPPGATCRVLLLSVAHPQPRLQQLPGVDALLARPFDLPHLLAHVAALIQAR